MINILEVSCHFLVETSKSRSKVIRVWRHVWKRQESGKKVEILEDVLETLLLYFVNLHFLPGNVIIWLSFRFFQRFENRGSRNIYLIPVSNGVGSQSVRKCPKSVQKCPFLCYFCSGTLSKPGSNWEKREICAFYAFSRQLSVLRAFASLILVSNGGRIRFVLFYASLGKIRPFPSTFRTLLCNFRATFPFCLVSRGLFGSSEPGRVLIIN